MENLQREKELEPQNSESSRTPLKPDIQEMLKREWSRVCTMSISDTSFLPWSAKPRDGASTQQKEVGSLLPWEGWSQRLKNKHQSLLMEGMRCCNGNNRVKCKCAHWTVGDRSPFPTQTQNRLVPWGRRANNFSSPEELAQEKGLEDINIWGLLVTHLDSCPFTPK